MAKIPLEDSFADVIGKAQRGLKISDDDLSKRAGISVEVLGRLKSGEFDESTARKAAPALNLSATALVELGKKAWSPPNLEVNGLVSFNTPFEDMTVNSYLVFDRKNKEAVAFDTGASCEGMLQFANENQLSIKLILLTHTHEDHIIDLARLRESTGAPAFVGELEIFSEAESFPAGRSFQVGDLKIETRQTSGHARGGITYVVSGLEKMVIVVGDALFAGSMGGGAISYEEALRTNRKEIFTLPDNVVICPGHGPLTTVGEEKANNPFYPEFKK